MEPNVRWLYHVRPQSAASLDRAQKSAARLRDKLRAFFRAGRGRALAAIIKDLAPLLRSWIAYFRFTDGKGVLEELDRWVRPKLRCILWRKWKRPRTRFMRLMQRGLTEQRARDGAPNGRGPWWNAGAATFTPAGSSARAPRSLTHGN
ncbi:group II intron maturase-specific domain-containing protein [Mesorhizobium sp.]|uniref:group II intron maturase-specific domain-containing protein n=1 Tax=Mesorhizobium sp. TaxID=1871066 RepID=UPI0025DB55CF|nr:group II intron maturase-specific domain-containing protein [Mesorhizobium sp.]